MPSVVNDSGKYRRLLKNGPEFGCRGNRFGRHLALSLASMLLAVRDIACYRKLGGIWPSGIRNGAAYVSMCRRFPSNVTMSNSRKSLSPLQIL